MISSRDCLLLTAITTGFLCMISATKNETYCDSSDAQHLDGPMISPCRSELILQMGENVTLLCKGKSELSFKQQEIPEEMIGPFTMSQRIVPSSDVVYKYEIALDLYNVDEFAIGYYACFDSSVNASDILNNLTDEPNNTEHISFIYIYVNGSDRLFAPMREVIIPRCSLFVIECRPTTPDVNVTLTADIADYKVERYSPKVGYIFDSDFPLDYPITGFNCRFTGRDRRTNKDVYVQKHVQPPPMPNVVRTFLSGYEPTSLFLKNETFYLNCTVKTFDVVSLEWKYPHSTQQHYEETNALNVSSGILYHSIRVENATQMNEGTYTCVSKNNCASKNNTFEMTYLDEALLKLTIGHSRLPMELSQKREIIRLNVEVEAYPFVDIYILKNNQRLLIDEEKYSVDIDSNHANLNINKPNLMDTGSYTFVASNKYKTENVTIDLRIKTIPTVYFDEKECLQNTTITLACHVTGYPKVDIEWTFVNGNESTKKSDRIDTKSLYEQTAFLDIKSCRSSGNITCKAKNSEGSVNVTHRFHVYEMPNGFGIKNREQTIFSEKQNVTLECLAAKYKFVNVTWLSNNGEDISKMENVILEHSTSSLSLVAKLVIKQISLNHMGDYGCHGHRTDGTVENETISISVAALQPLIIRVPVEDKIEEVSPFQKIQLNCQADGVPTPNIKWYKDNVLYENNTEKVTIYTNTVNFTTVNSTIEIEDMQEEKKGNYECLAFSNTGKVKKSYMVTLKAEKGYTTYLITIVIIIIALIVLVVYLTWKIKEEKRFRKELAAAGLLYFKEGVTKSINRDLGIDEQAELLPYDEKFEFPPEKLTLGKQLGAGAFGVVYKAEARGIINAEETTPVAVKMVKKTADNMYIKALASELKIMVHLGKHINIVNLLGACTTNVVKRELVVIVEYCKFGNIHNYMQRHREVFIDQLTDNKERNLGKVNIAFSSTSGTQSDYFGSANTQNTDHTFVNTANTNRSGRKDNPSQAKELVKVSEGYVQPEWRSNYESDYSFDGRNPRPLTSRDLLAWAFQIARGMEYLAGRKVLHGDLAARNVLLAEDNIVKICDFGLARSIYKNDEYQKQENSPLPVKWLAIECMTDRIFSTQSDVWSFGIVLWEMFSLAKTPYPNISPSNLLQWLSEGHRLEKPTYADDRIYNVMNRCWEQKPTARPSFSQLQEVLGTFLEDNVRNHYVDLNAANIDFNVRPDGEDYLAMVSAPDYNNLVTPSPHHYVNATRSFFPPTPTKIDEEGYLQMSPATIQNVFSPRPQGTTFDFDARKCNPRESEASSCGSELTPMLTLSNVPARSGSESDHEGNASPYLKMCPRIEEETDEVFEMKQNNAKNIQNSAVTNPTYITFDMGLEKKPKNIIHNYVNVNVPNGLVK